MMTATTAFIQGEIAAVSKKKVLTPWKSHDQSKRHTSEWKSDFQNQLKEGRGSNKFTPLTRMPKEIFAAKSGKFKPPPSMVTLVEKRSSNKFCEFHNDKGHNTDECVQLRKQIEELVRAGKLSHFIKEIRQDKDQQKTGKKDAPVKDKAVAIYMIQPWQRVTRQKVTQSFTRVKEITFPPLTANKGTEGPLVIEAKIGGHAVHRIYVDGGSSMEVLYEHCFNRLRPEIKSQMVLTTTSLTGFSGETIWSPSPYNGIIGRPGIRGIQAVPSTAYGMLKFPVNGGIMTIRSTILTPTECATIAATPKDSAKKVEARHENFKVAINPDFSDQDISIGGTKKRGQAPERAKEIQVEVQKLVEAGIMREDYYHDWLSNPVMVRKHDGSWRMCVDFTDLNKAYPQDCYPLPEIDWKVESLCGYPFKCFMDAYKGYHQIQMAKQEEEKTAFHTSHGVYCYTKMPFGLKNVGATYQRLVDKAFDRQIAEGMFLGYMINPKGIKPFPDKTEAVLQLPSPRTIKEVQSLNGKLASLNRFLSKSAEKSFPLFNTLKKCIKKSDFHWTPEAEQAFKQLKQHLAKLPMLVVPKPKEELIIYLSASYGAISAVLMTERDTVQTQVYFVIRALQAPELNYTPMEKLVLALVCAAKRLRRYFQAHPIVVITDQPIKQVISRPDVAGR
ncbi:reverse transcriptase domain-containing protein, partial [Tanacetum coccineum]